MNRLAQEGAIHVPMAVRLTGGNAGSKRRIGVEYELGELNKELNEC